MQSNKQQQEQQKQGKPHTISAQYTTNNYNVYSVLKFTNKTISVSDLRFHLFAIARKNEKTVSGYIRYSVLSLCRRHHHVSKARNRKGYV